MDASIFLAMQTMIGFSPFLDAAGVFCASVLIWFEAGAVVIFWLFDRRRRGLEFLSAPLAAAAGWLASAGIGLLYFRPRPFAVLANAQLLIDKSPLDKSFPSDHATVAFALAVSVLLVDRRWGYPLLATAVLISLARIFVGVHYLSDVAAGALLGAACAMAVHRLIHWWLHTRHQRA